MISGFLLVSLVFGAIVVGTGTITDAVMMRRANRRLQRLANRFHKGGAGGAARIVWAMQFKRGERLPARLIAGVSSSRTSWVGPVCGELQELAALLEAGRVSATEVDTLAARLGSGARSHRHWLQVTRETIGPRTHRNGH